MRDDFNNARAGLDAIMAGGTAQEAHIAALNSLVELFQPIEPMPRNEAMAGTRTAMQATCGNCGHTEVVMFMPAPLMGMAAIVIRRAICPRCFSTDFQIGGT